MTAPLEITNETALDHIRELRRKVDLLEERNERNAAVFNKWAQVVDDNFATVEDNRERDDNVTEAILRHLGVDMTGCGDPPTMGLAAIQAQLRIARERRTVRGRMTAWFSALHRLVTERSR